AASWRSPASLPLARGGDRRLHEQGAVVEGLRLLPGSERLQRRLEEQLLGVAALAAHRADRRALDGEVVALVRAQADRERVDGPRRALTDRLHAQRPAVRDLAPLADSAGTVQIA